MQTRIRVTINGKRMLRSHAVWNENHPNDQVKPGEAVHHKDENKLNDSPGNLEKMTEAEHKALHSQAGIDALTKWRKENPKEAKKVSAKSMKEFRKSLERDPVLKKEWEEKKRKGTIKANKARVGTKASEETKKKMSEAQRIRWATWGRSKSDG